MNTRNRFTKTLALGAVVAFILTCVAASQTDRVRARSADERGLNMRTGLITLGPGQTARLNVLLGGPDTLPGGERGARRLTLAFDIYLQAPPEPDSPPDDTVNNLRFLRRESRVVALMPGEGAFLDLSVPEGGAHISAVLLGGPDTSPSIGNPDIMPTLELMVGGSTTSVHIKWFNPQPDPPGGPVGL